jgi:hypothetical protein
MSLHPDEILAEHAWGESLTNNVLAALIREGVDIAAICCRVARGALDAPRLDRIVHLSETAFEFARHQHGHDCVAVTLVCLIAGTGGATWPISVYLMVFAAITFLAAWFAPETASKTLD